jgi:ubiquinone/menaquinone biosynthesis C-methylase UbiE
MSFSVGGEKYDRFMGRYSRQLAPLFADFAGVSAGMTAVDVGCGPGALTGVLVERLGAENVAGADPSEPFVAAAREAAPGADVRQAPGEQLPWEDDSFDAALSQLAVNFMRDADAGVGEMRRVVRPGGVVSACTWALEGGNEMLDRFWAAAGTLDSQAPDEGPAMRYRTFAEQEELWGRAGLDDIRTDSLRVEYTYSDFDDMWEPFTDGVGPAGQYLVALEPDRQEALRAATFSEVGEPSGRFTLRGTACAVRGSVPAA